MAQVATLLPQPDRSVVAVGPPGPGEGTWAGAPSAACYDGEIYLAYRLRRPEGQGRGYAVAVARSADGVHFETLAHHRPGADGRRVAGAPGDRADPGRDVAAVPELRHDRDQALARGGSRGRRIRPPSTRAGAGSCCPATRAPRSRTRCSSTTASIWHLWASVHPLADPDEADQMVTDYAVSPDGLSWTWQGTALGTRPGEWDSRGARVTAVRLDARQRRGLLRRAGQRGGELRGADRRGLGDRARRADRARADRPVAVR